MLDLTDKAVISDLKEELSRFAEKTGRFDFVNYPGMAIDLVCEYSNEPYDFIRGAIPFRNAPALVEGNKSPIAIQIMYCVRKAEILSGFKIVYTYPETLGVKTKCLKLDLVRCLRGLLTRIQKRNFLIWRSKSDSL